MLLFAQCLLMSIPATMTTTNAPTWWPATRAFGFRYGNTSRLPYEKMAAFAHNPLGKLILLGAVALPTWHAAHRLRMRPRSRLARWSGGPGGLLWVGRRADPGGCGGAGVDLNRHRPEIAVHSRLRDLPIRH
jgi:Fumarate reductase subunit D